MYDTIGRGAGGKQFVHSTVGCPLLRVSIIGDSTVYTCMYVCMCSGVWHVCLCVFSYCLQPEDSQMDARMTRIQQRYLLSERASNCSSSNTPEVKVEQRRRRRLKRAETSSAHDERREKDELGVATSQQARERLELTVREKERESDTEKKSEVVSGGIRTATEGEKISLAPGQAAERAGGSSGSVRSRIKLSKSPVVKLHRIQTPPSAAGPGSLLTRLTDKSRASYPTQRTAEPGLGNSLAESLSPPSGQPRLESAVEDTSGCGTGEVSAVSKLRRSPRKNKWTAGKPAGSGAPGETRQAAKKEKSHKKVARWWHMQIWNVQ